ncbi:MAG: hypothetical protein ACKN9T_17500 [Candidatus Methylumidiphilus sp.]
MRQYLLYIGKQPLNMAGNLSQPALSYQYQIVDMREVDGQTLLDQDAPEAWVLAVLCDFKGRAAQDIIHAILTRLIARVGGNPARLREYVEMLDILASNRELNLNIKEELDMLNVDIEKLAVYQIGMERGLGKGIERGIEQGLEQGIEKGVQIGVEKGFQLHAEAVAKKLLAQGMPPAQIADIIELPLAAIEALQRGKNA